ncbi:hypothetical protein L596_020976 [Steinernema carpocapsae]|uniref:7TM GPCR serpentine receptor class x (Srx) domain-containing protein n=1 Tax=Steinernema carpocapsae TaxID=34508 RepID=A0A4V6A121_STECR|nr:hypothetical protein L596_020976 [Steinernema carpocapsae]
MQYVPLPFFMIFVAQFTWQASTGGSVFVFLFMNKTIRRGVIKLLLRKTVTSTVYIATSGPQTDTRNSVYSQRRVPSAQIDFNQNRS